MWGVFDEAVVSLAMEGSICSTFVYPVITGLFSLCDCTVVLAAAALSPPSSVLLLLHLHRHGSSSHRGDPLHRKLQAWQDKIQRSSDTVPWQPVRAAENNKRNLNNVWEKVRADMRHQLCPIQFTYRLQMHQDKPSNRCSYLPITRARVTLATCSSLQWPAGRRDISLSQENVTVYLTLCFIGFHISMCW